MGDNNKHNYYGKIIFTTEMTLGFSGDKLKDLFSKNADGPSFDLILTPKEREAYQKAMKKMKGGGELIYKTTGDDLHKTCDKIKKEKNIYKHQLDLINGC